MMAAESQLVRSERVCVCVRARVLNKQTMEQQLQQIVSGANLL